MLGKQSKAQSNVIIAGYLISSVIHIDDVPSVIHSSVFFLANFRIEQFFVEFYAVKKSLVFS